MERDEGNYSPLIYLKHFNSHAHVERDSTMCYNIITVKDFNSHAHVERDERLTDEHNTIQISTHTLTWSVTIGIGINAAIIYISTHTLTWSVTTCKNMENPSNTFQLTRSRGA